MRNRTFSNEAKLNNLNEPAVHTLTSEYGYLLKTAIRSKLFETRII